MFGYIVPLKSELKLREFEVYNAYYCAICHAVKRRYGELPRYMLSYDAVLVAILSDALEDGSPQQAPRTFRCLANPMKKRHEMAESIGIDYAADVMVLLGWLSLKDRKTDSDTGSPLKSLAVRIMEAAMRGAGRRAAERLDGKAGVCFECIRDQSELEAAKTDSLDRAADPTGRMMAELMDFTGPGPSATERSKALRGMGYHIGRFIYYIDAIDDLEKDKKTGAYNPLLLRPVTAEALKTAMSLDLAQLGELAGNFLWLRHKGIIENIIYLGLHARMDEVLGGME